MPSLDENSGLPARLQEWANLHPQLMWSYRGAVAVKGRNCHAISPFLFGWLIRRGWCETRSEGVLCRAEAGQWIFPPVAPRHQRFSRGARIISVSFRANWPGGRSAFDHGSGLICESRAAPDLETTADALCAWIEREFPNAGNQLFLQAATLSQHWQINWLFSDWLRAYTEALGRLGVCPDPPQQADPRCGQALQLIERQALNLPFREAPLARAVGLSVPQLNRLFARHLGETPRTRFEARRREAALSLLRQSARPIKAISADLGFSSPAHFTRWCSKQCQRTPKAIRDGK